MDIYDLLMEESEPNAQQKAQAMAAALRRKQAVGDLATLTGDKVLSRFGQAQMQRADGELDHLAGAGRFRGGQALQRTLAQQGQEFRAAEGEKDRGSRERQGALNRSLQRELLGKKQEAATEKAETKAGDKMAGFYLEGYELLPEARPQNMEVRLARDAQAQVRNARDSLREISALYKKYGTEALPSEARAKMAMLTRDLQLSLKGEAGYQLGVLTGPDLALLNEITGNPTDTKANVLSFFGGSDNTLARFTTLDSTLQKKFESKVRSLGYRPKLAANVTAPAGAAPADLEAPVRKTVNGKTFEMGDDGWYEVTDDG